jgi:hypothetical protein
MGGKLVLVVLAVLGLFPAAAAAGDVPFQRAAYNLVDASDAGGITTMTVTARPGGLSYTAELDPTKTYRLRIVGRTAQTGVVMRIRTDDRLQYLRAPNGLYGARVVATKQLEILLFRHYASDDEQYRIFEVSLQDCAAACPGDADLRNEILRARPGLAAALAREDRLAAAVEVMHWAAPRIPVSGGSPLLQTRTDGLTAAELWYEQLRSNEVGVLCGGASAFLIKLLDLFDIPSFELDFGDPAVYTHATVVVDAGDAITPAWHLLDPTYDAVLQVAGSGAPLPLPEALEAWRAGRSDLIDVRTESLVGRPIVTDPDGDGIVETLRCDEDAASGWSGCGLAQLAHDFDEVFDDAGHGRGYDAMLSLLARGTLFSTDHFGTPEAFQAMHDTLRAALRDDDAAVHVADLPLAPRNVTAPSLARAGVADVFTVDAGSWRLRPGNWDRARQDLDSSPRAGVRWLRCRDRCVAIAGAAQMTYAPSLADVGARLIAEVSVANRWGSTTTKTSATAPIAAQTPVDAPRSLLSPREESAVAPAGRPATRATPPRLRIEGVRRVGEGLRCVARGLQRSAHVTWWREHAGRVGTNGRRYVVRSKDTGHRIACRAAFGGSVVRSRAVPIRAGRR